MLYLTRTQIRAMVDRIGQPKASVILNQFFINYRQWLNSADVNSLYDTQYFSIIENHPIAYNMMDKYKINIYNRYSYEYLSHRISQNMRILDVGCGTGDFSLALAAESGVLVLGVDMSSNAIEVARKKQGTDLPNCRFECLDVTNLNPSPDEKFNFIILNDVTEHLSDKELTLLFTKIRHLLTQDGEVIIHTPNGIALCNDTDSSVLQILFKLYLRLFKGWKGFERSVEQLYYHQTHINIKSYREYKKILTSLGYKSKVIYDESYKPAFMTPVSSSNMLVICTLK